MYHYMKTNSILLSLIATLALGHASAQTAANWNFNGTLNGTAGTNITATTASLPSTTVGSFNSGSEYYGEGGWPAGAVDPSVYLEFTLNAGTSYYLSLNSVTLAIRRSTTGTGSGPQQWSLRSSVDNYTTDIQTGTLSTSYVTTVVNLSTAYQSIPSSVSFRLYGYNMVTTSGGNNRFVWDNVSVQGQAVSSILAEHAISLQAKAEQHNSVELQWNTTGFSAGTELMIERSTDGINFSTIGAQSWNASNDAVYQYEDISMPAAARVYYRISANETNGGVYTSPIVAIQENAAQAMQIIAIAGQGMGSAVKTMLNIPETGEYQLIVSSLDGKTLSKRMISGGAGRTTMDLDLGVHLHGAYILTLSKGGQATSREFID
jgi:hypothetical protein